jgi:hypothetical protein
LARTIETKRRNWRIRGDSFKGDLEIPGWNRLLVCGKRVNLKKTRLISNSVWSSKGSFVSFCRVLFANLDRIYLWILEMVWLFCYLALKHHFVANPNSCESHWR